MGKILCRATRKAISVFYAFNYNLIRLESIISISCETTSCLYGGVKQLMNCLEQDRVQIMSCVLLTATTSVWHKHATEIFIANLCSVPSKILPYKYHDLLSLQQYDNFRASALNRSRENILQPYINLLNKVAVINEEIIKLNVMWLWSVYCAFSCTTIYDRFLFGIRVWKHVFCIHYSLLYEATYTVETCIHFP